VLAAYDLDPGRVHVARPGVDAAEPTEGLADGGRLLCVGAVTPGKGHDVLVAALAHVVDQPWRCVCVGSLTRDRAFVTRLRRCVDAAELGHRVELRGPRTGVALQQAYATADALVLASRAETYGMVVTEALARAVPVLASDTGGVTEALGTTGDGVRPGLLTPPGDVDALAEALRGWLTRPELRRELRAAARERRATLTGWSETAGRVGRVLQEVTR
jgi:glycosyltransferase involved in cell wall biosynthesis